MQPAVDSVVYIISNDPGSDWATSLSAIAAIFSVITACIALVFTHKQNKMHEKHNKLMATPYLSSMIGANEDTNEFSFQIENVGLGPAIIKEITVFINDVPLSGTFAEMVEKALTDLLPNRSSSYLETFSVADRVPANKKYSIITVTSTGLSAYAIHAALSAATIEIKYSSIYDETYTYNSEEN